MGSTIKKLGDIVEINDASWSKNLNWDTLLYLDTANITNGIIEDLVSYQIKTDEIPSRARRLAKEGDIIYSTVRPNQRHFGILENIPTNLVVSTGFTTIRSKFPNAYPTKFIYYLLTQNHITNYLHGIAENNTSAYPSLRPQDILDLEFEFPDINDQIKTISLISKIDRKFQLNQEINLTLEEIAKAIFKSWFVDFDPVHAKVEGKPTGLPDEISDLFPSEFVDSELGEIPAGWEIGEINDLCDYISSGGTPSRNNQAYWDDGTVDWYKTGELKDCPLLNAEEKVTQIGIEKSSAKIWDRHTILFAIYASPTVGRLGYLVNSGSCNQAAAGLVAKDAVGMPFLYWTLFNARGYLQNIAVGAAQQNINVGILKSHKIIIPSPKLMHLFSMQMLPIELRRENLFIESKNLSDLRNTLLPKLISGELQIPDAAKFLEGVRV